MKTFKILLLTAFIMLTALSCEKDKIDNMVYKEIELSSVQKSLVSSNNTFSFEILKTVSENEVENTNIMISPLSMGYALGMTVNGAKNNTLEQMLDLLGFDQSLSDCNDYFKYLYGELVNLDPEVELSISNSIWYKEGFELLQSFIHVNQTYYDAKIQSLDFTDPASKDIINEWVNDVTRGKIESIIDDDISPQAVMFLINAIYFYGNWKYTFDASETQNENFFLANGTTILTPMMRQETDLRRAYIENIGTAVELPYGRENYAMLLILPENEDSPNDVIQQLNDVSWNQCLSQLDTEGFKIVLPKFSFEYERTLNDDLKALGMIDAFNDLADFSGINGMGGLFISEVKHKTFIELDEEGTEAAAVTSVGIEFTSAGEEIKFNKPFIFFIYEKSTGVILFSGKVANP